MGSFFSFGSRPEKEKKTDELTSNGFKYCVSEMKGDQFNLNLGWRDTMEDASICNCNLGDGNALFAVFDGHLGSEVSEYVKQIFVKILTDNSFYKEKKYPEALRTTFETVDSEIKKGEKMLKNIREKNIKENKVSENKNENISGSVGCTANVVLITKDKIFCANIGDSRSALSYKDKSFKQLSYDHKPDDPKEKARIENAGGEVINGRIFGGLNLSRSFGDFDYKESEKKNLKPNEQLVISEPDIRSYDRKNAEFIIIGCDGIWEKYVDKTEDLVNRIRDSLQKTNNYKKTLEGLLESMLAKKKGEAFGCDNMTAILIGFT